VPPTATQILGVPATGRASERTDRFLRILADHAGLILLIGVHLVVSIAVGWWIRAPFMTANIVETGSFIGGFLLFTYLLMLLVGRALYIALVVRPARPAMRLIADIRAVCSFERIAGGTLLLLIFMLFAAGFTVLKAAIPMLHPFSWDRTFLAWDLALHGGRFPYQILWPLLGNTAATTLVNFVYHAWLFVLYAIVFTEAFSTTRDRLRLRFFYAFVLTWSIGGNLLALIFSSAGPVYLERLGLGADYAPLMSALHAFHQIVPVWALRVQDALWSSYAGAGGGIVGISAMPSMHVASSVLLACYGFSRSRRLGWLLTAFTVTIAMGSVHLGWHYAVDGYIGAGVALACWWAAGRLAEFDRSRRARARSGGPATEEGL
jgi:hypothetical protein